MTEEQPVPAGGPSRAPLLQESTKRRHAGAGPDHDDGYGRIRRQTEGVSFLHVDAQGRARRAAFGEIGRRHAQPRAAADVVAHRIDRESDATRISAGRG
jgi:hypothetical protein